MTNISNGVKTEHYADALIQMAAQDSPHDAVRSLAKHLERRGQGSMLWRLRAALLRRMSVEKRGAVLEVANVHHATHARHEAHDVLALLGNVTVREDESLIGGWRVVSKNKLVDNSFKKHLLGLYRRMVSN